VYRSRPVAEGGGFCSDGEGTVITAETCILNPNRNPGTTKSEAQAELRALLGARKVIWLPGDATETETDVKGRHFQLVSIPEAPRSAIAADASPGQFCRPSVNFYLANGAVVAPACGIDEDCEVFEVLEKVYPDRQVVPVQVETLCRGGGGMHCITQQEPLGSGAQ
jgi:agmatine deiminase